MIAFWLSKADQHYTQQWSRKEELSPAGAISGSLYREPKYS
jgi:hypothetical protein